MARRTSPSSHTITLFDLIGKSLNCSTGSLNAVAKLGLSDDRGDYILVYKSDSKACPKAVRRPQ